MKLIEGVIAARAIPEFGSAAADCMPTHRVSDEQASFRRYAQTVAGQPGARPRWHGAERRADSGDGDGEVSAAFRGGMAGAGSSSAFWTNSWFVAATGMCRGSASDYDAQFLGPIQTIIPWASNYYTETLISGYSVNSATISGASGCSAACPAAAWALSSRRKRRRWPKTPAGIMTETKRELEHALPFAMEPVVYDFAINEHGTFAELLSERRRTDAGRYYALTVPALLRLERHAFSAFASR